MTHRHALFDRLTERKRAAIIPRLRDLLALRDGQRLLDLGGGTGQAAAMLAHKGEVVVVEPDARKVAHGRAARPGLRFKEASAEQLPYPEFHFDAAMALMTVHHWSDPTAGLREVWRVLQPGGRLVVYELPPSRARWLSRIERRLGHPAHFLEPEALAGLLHDAGFPKVELYDAPRGYLVRATR
jgi:ubiquinone/menaquinone biosynthesis C-methylase UbiE